MTKTQISNKFVVTFDTKHLARIRGELAEMLYIADVSSRESALIVLAVDEVLSAIITHARGMGLPGDVKICAEVNDVCFKVVIDDTSNSIDLEHLSEPERACKIQRLRGHTMAFGVVCAVMDEVSYSWKKHFENSVTMTRFIRKS
jgi:anti-sigma regulatory factor (Ser/Thr protein kinase)